MVPQRRVAAEPDESTHRRSPPGNHQVRIKPTIHRRFRNSSPWTRLEPECADFYTPGLIARKSEDDMKTTERQPEPQAEEPLNDVSDVLSQIAPYWRTIAGVSAVVVTAVVLYGITSTMRQSAEESAWASYFDAVGNSDANALQIVAENSSGKVVPWAYQSAAQSKLIEATQNLYTDRELAKTGFEEAIDGFTKAISRSEDTPLLNQRSLWGLAQAHEGLNTPDKAKATYERLQERWPESPLAKRAQERIAMLDDSSTKDFYTWFFAQTPTPPPAFDAAPSQPFSVPDEPDVVIPDVGDSVDASTETAPAPETDEDLPADATVESTTATEPVDDESLPADDATQDEITEVIEDADTELLSPDS